MRVYVSRHEPTLRPGDGERIRWEVGETVRIMSGPDAGRQFVITSEPMRHADAPDAFVREGYFTDDPTQALWAKPERQFWMDG